MTDYSPLYDALDGDAGNVTVEEMIESGYDDFEAGEPELSSVQAHLVSALDSLDGQIMDDCAKWRAVNQIVGAMQEIDKLTGARTTAHVSSQSIGATVEPRGDSHE